MAKFITIEGIEGSGKSTLQKGLAEHFESKGQEVMVTREPGATKLGFEIRNLLLHSKDLAIDPKAELLLFCADRAQHVNSVVRPALKADKVVICDRYYHSTIAYQGYGRGLDLKELRELCDIATGNLEPDVVLLLDLDPTEGLKRAKKQTEEEDTSYDRMEEEEIEFHTRIREGFLAMSKDPSNNFVVLDATLPPHELLKAAIKALD